MKERRKQSSQQKKLAVQELPTAESAVNERERKTIELILKCNKESLPPKLEKDGDSYKPVDNGKDYLISYAESFGSGYMDFVFYQAELLASIAKRGPTARGANAHLAFMHGFAPKDEIESLLGSQMIAAHELAMTCMSKASHSESVEYVDLKINQSTKLLRAFALQVEALNRYRGKGQQKVTVEHVTVNSGGQAIVGNVDPSGGRVSEKK